MAPARSWGFFFLASDWSLGKYMKKLILGLTIIGLAVGSVLWSYASKPNKKPIEEVNTLSHHRLNSVRTGFETTITNMMGDAISLAYYNAEGNVQQANLIAQKIASDKNIIAVLTIGSLATQTLAKAEKTRPIIFAAVSDPKI